MKKKIVITGIVLVAVVILVLVGYNIYRYPATFRRLLNQSLNEEQVNEQESLEASEIPETSEVSETSGTRNHTF